MDDRVADDVSRTPRLVYSRRALTRRLPWTLGKKGALVWPPPFAVFPRGEEFTDGQSVRTEE
jgi:hypothetical protein